MQHGVVTKLKSAHCSALCMGLRFSLFHCRPTECHHPSVLHSGRPQNSSIHLFHKPLPNRSLLPLLSLGYSTRVSCFTILQPLGHLPEFYCCIVLQPSPWAVHQNSPSLTDSALCSISAVRSVHFSLYPFCPTTQTC